MASSNGTLASLQQSEGISELWLLSEGLYIKVGLGVEGSISAIQVALYRWSGYHGTPNNGLGRNTHRNPRVLCRWLYLRRMGWLSRTRELGSLRRGPRSRPLSLVDRWHRFSGWPPGGVSALRRGSPLRWGNGRVLNRWRSGASHGGLMWSRRR